MLSFYQLALNEFNKGQPSYCNPRKGTADYLAVKQYADELEIAKNLKKKKPAKPKAVSAPAPKPAKAKAKAVPKSDEKDMPISIKKKTVKKTANVEKPKADVFFKTIAYLNSILNDYTGPEKQHIERTIKIIDKTQGKILDKKPMPLAYINELEKLETNVDRSKGYSEKDKIVLYTTLQAQIFSAIQYRDKLLENLTLNDLTVTQRKNLKFEKEYLQEFMEKPVVNKVAHKQRLIRYHNKWLRNAIPKHLKKDIFLLLRKIATKYQYKDIVDSIDAYLDG